MIKTSNKKEAEQVSLWQERISVSRKYLEHISEERGWKRFIKQYQGDYGILLWKNIQAPPINDVYSYVQTTLSNLYTKDPYITVNPAKTGTVRGAAIWEAWVNYFWRELKIAEQIELEIIDAELAARAWHKTGINVFGISSEEQLKSYSEKTYSQRVSWQDICFNVGSVRPPYDSQWVAHRLIRPLADMKKRFPAAKKLEGQTHPFIDGKEYKKIMYKDDISVGIMHEIWDASERKIYLIADGLDDKFLAEFKDWPDYLDEFPFNELSYIQIPDNPFPIAPIAPIEPQILEKITILSQAVNHIKRWNRQCITKRGAMSSENLDKFEKGIDGSILEVNTTDSLETAFKLVDFGQLPTDFYLIIDRLDQIIRTTSGQPEFDKGGITRTQTRTLGELSLIRSGARSRTDKKINRFELYLSNIARHLIAHGKASFDLEQVIKVTGDTPQSIIEAFKDNFDPISRNLRFKPDEIMGEYDVTIKAGSTLPKDMMTRMEILEKILSTIAQVVVNSGMSPFMRELITEILHDYELKGLEVAFQKEQIAYEQSLQAKSQQANIIDAKVVAETEKRKAQADNIDVDTALKEEALSLPHEIRQMMDGGNISNGM